MRSTYTYPKDFVVGFAEKDTREGETFEIACNKKEIEIDEAPFKNWIPQSHQDTGRSIKSYRGTDPRVTH